jgi:hypothetical protein
LPASCRRTARWPCQWATRTLREHLIRGYALNRQRFESNARELEATLQLVRKAAQINNDIGLAALALLVAESEPAQKETMIRLVMNMLAPGLHEQSRNT